MCFLCKLAVCVSFCQKPNANSIDCNIINSTRVFLNLCLRRESGNFSLVFLQLLKVASSQASAARRAIKSALCLACESKVSRKQTDLHFVAQIGSCHFLKVLFQTSLTVAKLRGCNFKCEYSFSTQLLLRCLQTQAKRKLQLAKLEMKSRNK